MFEDAGRLAQMIDHALLRPDATFSDLERACGEAMKYGFSSLVVPSIFVKKTKGLLSGSTVKISSTVGFPFGSSTTTVKIVEAMEAIKNGADELEIVANISAVKSGAHELAEIDIKNIVLMTPNVIHKIILETGLLTPDETVRLCQIALRAGAEFVKTCTGFGPRGASIEDVRLMRRTVGSSCRVKAAGGIKDLAAVTALVEAGAERIGTSSGPAIMEEYLKSKG